MTPILEIFFIVFAFLLGIGLLVSKGPDDWDGPFP